MLFLFFFVARSQTVTFGPLSAKECSEAIFIPSDVTHILENTFVACKAILKTITFEENSNLLEFGISACEGCTLLRFIDFSPCVHLGILAGRCFCNSGLNQIVFSSICSLSTIGGHALSGLKNFTIEVPSSVVNLFPYPTPTFESTSFHSFSFAPNSKISELPLYVFSRCSFEVSLFKLPKSITSIPGQPWLYVTTIDRIELEEGSSFAEQNGIVYSDSTFRTIIVCPPAKRGKFVEKNDVKMLHGMCFRSSSLTEIDLSKTQFDTIPFAAFGDIQTEVEVIFLPPTLKIISSYAFQFSRLKKLEITSPLERIESAAFLCCSLSILKLPNTIVFVGSNAFQGSGTPQPCVANDPRVIRLLTKAGLSEDCFVGCPTLEFSQMKFTEKLNGLAENILLSGFLSSFYHQGY